MQQQSMHFDKNIRHRILNEDLKCTCILIKILDIEILNEDLKCTI